jgi:uncharacterized protein DUF6505
VKLLRTIRFDDTDNNIFGVAAGPDEWAISGAFAFVDVKPDMIAGKEKQAFRNGWLGLSSFARATFVSVADAGKSDFEQCSDQLAGHLIEVYGAPGKPEALAAATAEMEFTADFCSDVPINTLFAVLREFDEQGAIHEEFRIIQPPTGLVHTKVWEVEEDDA